MTIAMKPCPWVMKGVKIAGRDDGEVRAAEPGERTGGEPAKLRVAMTLTPAASSASGFSPAARRFRPTFVDRKIQATSADEARRPR